MKPIQKPHIETIHELQQVIGALPGNVYWKDAAGCYLGCNQNVARILKISSPEAIIGKTNQELLGKDYAKLVEENDRLVLEEGKEVATEEVGFNENGEEAIYLSVKKPLFDLNKNIVGLIGIGIEITELKRAQEREKFALAQVAQAEIELRQAVMILAGSIAHDLRTPVSNINLDSYSLKKPLQILVNTYRKTQEINDELLMGELSPKELSHIENYGASLQSLAYQMNNFIDATLQTLTKSLKEDIKEEDLNVCSMRNCIHNTITRYPFAEGENKLVEWDRGEFTFKGNEILMIRVISNLLTNSLQQIEKNKKGKIFIKTEKMDTMGVVRFRDTAGGAAPEIVKHLFEGYRTTKAKGTGIGLSFCKITLQSFNGNIECHSVEGDYIEFVLSLPLVYT